MVCRVVNGTRAEGEKTVLVGIDTYHLIRYTLCVQVFPDRRSVRKKVLYRFFMQYDNFFAVPPYRVH